RAHARARRVDGRTAARRARAYRRLRTALRALDTLVCLASTVALPRRPACGRRGGSPVSLLPRIARRVAEPAPELPPDLHAVTRRVLAGRGLRTPADLDCALGGLLPPHALGGLEHAAALVADSLTRDRRILVIGDFDA